MMSKPYQLQAIIMILGHNVCPFERLVGESVVSVCYLCFNFETIIALSLVALLAVVESVPLRNS